MQVYTFLQDVQAAYNPAFIIKTDDDLYIRQVFFYAAQQLRYAHDTL